jgi:hypothetical protein
MLTKTKLALAALAVIGSASVAAAQYDGDGNLIPGAHQQNVLVRQAPAVFGNAFASTRSVRTPVMERDGDGNVIGGW